MKILFRLILVGLIASLTVTETLAQTNTRLRSTEAPGSEVRTDPPAMGAQGNDDDQLKSLRDQIAAATVAHDRNRLQLKLADELVKTGHKTEAVSELFAMLKATDFDPISFYNLGNAFARLGETEPAIAAY